jgi:hypothetical protein
VLEDNKMLRKFGYNEPITLNKSVTGAEIIEALQQIAREPNKEYVELTANGRRDYLQAGIAGWLHDEDVAIRSGIQGETMVLQQDELYDRLFVVNVGSDWASYGVRKIRPKMLGNPVKIVQETRKRLENILNS